MNTRRFILASAAIFLFALAWNAVVHLVILRGPDAALASVARPEAERSLPLGLAVTAAIAVLFVWGYGRCARRGTVVEGLGYGAFFGVVAGVLVDLNQYMVYPLPGSLVTYWFLFGLAEFCIYGVLASIFYPVTLKAGQPTRPDAES